MQVQGKGTKSFFGTWKLLPGSCKYDQGTAPVQATHTLSKGPDQQTIHVQVYWKQADGKTKEFSYNIKTDGHPHPEKYNNYDMNVTGKVDGHSLKVSIVNDKHSCTYEADGQGKRMELHMKYLKDGKWVNIYQSYVQ